MRRTNNYLDDEQTAELDRLAAATGASRAEVIRRLLDEALGRTPDTVERDLATFDATFGALVDVELATRHAGEREAHLDRTWRRPA
jgi:hypothetical protein